MSEVLEYGTVIVAIVGLTVGLGGLLMNADTDGMNDPDCKWSKNERQREDQETLYDAPAPGCERICEEGHVWFKWGHDEDCHWDDKPPRAKKEAKK